ncbi:hypothetical protein ACPPVT_07440 [Angustibacter sp. McL0619]|uniref:hypothetical protein n=1 Tax=Angustibacter sp. McL0619 TaxID=3415676 RepID=UPI003CEF8470
MTAITTGEILFKYSVKTGSAGNSTAGTAAGSLGTYMSTTAWTGGSANDLFDDISGAENAASTVDYRCIFVHNSNAANPLQNAVAYLSAEVSGGAGIAIAVDSTAESIISSSSAQALTGTSETAPGGSVTGLTYSSPTTAGTGIALGTIPAGHCRAIWIRRTAANSAALSADGVTLAVTGDTGSL